ncbi:MAG: c-type cytochrome domain-containing protein, partial [Acidobacteriota bacterium]
MKFAPLLALSVFACAQAAEVQFNRDIRPILSDRCYTCHGPDKNQRKSKLRLDIESEAKSDLGGGKRAIIAGDPEHSTLVQRVESQNKTLRMPPAYLGHERLKDAEIAALKRWIAEGAHYQSHWSFIAPVKADLPSVGQTGWV